MLAKDETETSSTVIERDRIKGNPYKNRLAASPTVSWAYKYNTPIDVAQLTKVPAKGRNTNNIIVEKL